MFQHVWIKALQRPHSIQRIASFFLNFFTTGLPDDPAVRMNSAIIIPGEGKYDYYFYEDEWMNFLGGVERISLAMGAEKAKKAFADLDADMRVLGKEIFEKDVKKLDNATLADWFRRYYTRLHGLSVFAFTPSAIDAITAERLQAQLIKMSPTKAEEWFEVIGTPTMTNTMTEQRLDLLEIAVTKDESRLVEHSKRFFWLPVYTIGDATWSMEDFRKQLSELENPEGELLKMREDIKKRRERYDEVVQEIQADADVQNMIDVVHLYTHLRDARIDLTRIVFCLIAPFYQELARRSELPLNCVLNLLNEEILEFLKSGILPENAAERARHVVHAHDGRIDILTGKAMDELVSKELASVLNVAMKEFKGMIAYKGVVRGRARVIRAADQLSTLEAGEILVTHHTTPIFVTAMKKASAIVTDEGGITSHAAIVSRELKIPCITATRHGSAVIKTGDLLEVDAEKGIVKILSS